MTSTSVGYGDLSITKESSRLFSFFYVLVSAVLVAASISRWSKIALNMRMERKKAKLLRLQVDKNMVSAMDADGDGKVDSGKYLAAMLLAIGKMSAEVTEPILAWFKDLYRDGSGSLDYADFERELGSRRDSMIVTARSHKRGVSTAL